MDCRQFREVFSEYADGALDGAAASAAREHLAACLACRRVDRAYRAGVAALRALPALRPTRDLSARIVNRARRRPARSPWSTAPALAGSALAAAAIALIVLGPSNLGVDGASSATLADAPRSAEGTPRAFDRPTDHITLRVEAEAFPSMASYSAFSSSDSWSGPSSDIRIRFDVPAIWSGR